MLAEEVFQVVDTYLHQLTLIDCFDQMKQRRPQGRRGLYRPLEIELPSPEVPSRTGCVCARPAACLCMIAAPRLDYRRPTDKVIRFLWAERVCEGSRDSWVAADNCGYLWLEGGVHEKEGCEWILPDLGCVVGCLARVEC